MAGESTYPIRFASPRRDCALDATFPGAGKLVWSTQLELAGATARPTLLLWQGNVVAVAGFGFALFDKDGARRWERRKNAGGPATAFADRIYYQNADFGLDAVDVSNETPLTGAPLPGVANSEFKVSLLWPRAEDFVMATFVEAEQPEPENLGVQPMPMISGRRAVYGKTLGAWAADYSGFKRLPPLFVPALHRLLLGFDEVKVVDVNEGVELPGFTLPLQTHVDWSADPEGGLCITGYDTEDKKAVVGLSASGEEQWRWVDADGTDRWIRGQPPIRAQGGRIYALTEGRVLAIEQGVLAWSFDARSDSLRHGASQDGGTFTVTSEGVLQATETLRHATSLSDGSLLLTGGRTLRHLDPQGFKVRSISLGEDILTPPVVDEDGALYLATANTLFRFD